MDKMVPQTQAEYIKALMKISKAITSDLYLEDLLKLIVMVTANVTGVAICSLWLIDENENPPKIKLKATQSIEPEYIKDRSLELNEGVVGHVVSSKRPLIIKDVIKSKRFKEKEMAKRLDLSSMVGVPLQLKDEKVIGALNCFTTTPHNFSRTDVNLLCTVANQAAVAILNTELMVKSQVIQKELETHKLVERAKEILMTRSKLTGSQAHRWIQKKSMDSRIKVSQVAEAIVLSEDLEL